MHPLTDYLNDSPLAMPPTKINLLLAQFWSPLNLKLLCHIISNSCFLWQHLFKMTSCNDHCSLCLLVLTMTFVVVGHLLELAPLLLWSCIVGPVSSFQWHLCLSYLALLLLSLSLAQQWLLVFLHPPSTLFLSTAHHLWLLQPSHSVTLEWFLSCVCCLLCHWFDCHQLHCQCHCILQHPCCSNPWSFATSTSLLLSLLWSLAASQSWLLGGSLQHSTPIHSLISWELGVAPDLCSLCWKIAIFHGPAVGVKLHKVHIRITSMHFPQFSISTSLTVSFCQNSGPRRASMSERVPLCATNSLECGIKCLSNIDPTQQ